MQLTAAWELDHAVWKIINTFLQVYMIRKLVIARRAWFQKLVIVEKLFQSSSHLQICILSCLITCFILSRCCWHSTMWLTKAAVLTKEGFQGYILLLGIYINVMTRNLCMLNFFQSGGVLLREIKEVRVLHTIPQHICNPLHSPLPFSQFLFFEHIWKVWIVFFFPVS